MLVRYVPSVGPLFRIATSDNFDVRYRVRIRLDERRERARHHAPERICTVPREILQRLEYAGVLVALPHDVVKPRLIRLGAAFGSVTFVDLAVDLLAGPVVANRRPAHAGHEFVAGQLSCLEHAPCLRESNVRTRLPLPGFLAVFQELHRPIDVLLAVLVRKLFERRREGHRVAAHLLRVFRLPLITLGGRELRHLLVPRLNETMDVSMRTVGFVRHIAFFVFRRRLIQHACNRGDVGVGQRRPGLRLTLGRVRRTLVFLDVCKAEVCLIVLQRLRNRTAKLRWNVFHGSGKPRVPLRFRNAVFREQAPFDELDKLPHRVLALRASGRVELDPVDFGRGSRGSRRLRGRCRCRRSRFNLSERRNSSGLPARSAPNRRRYRSRLRRSNIFCWNRRFAEQLPLSGRRLHLLRGKQLGLAYCLRHPFLIACEFRRLILREQLLKLRIRRNLLEPLPAVRRVQIKGCQRSGVRRRCRLQKTGRRPPCGRRRLHAAPAGDGGFDLHRRYRLGSRRRRSRRRPFHRTKRPTEYCAGGERAEKRLFIPLDRVRSHQVDVRIDRHAPDLVDALLGDFADRFLDDPATRAYSGTAYGKLGNGPLERLTAEGAHHRAAGTRHQVNSRVRHSQRPRDTEVRPTRRFELVLRNVPNGHAVAGRAHACSSADARKRAADPTCGHHAELW